MSFFSWRRPWKRSTPATRRCRPIFPRQRITAAWMFGLAGLLLASDTVRAGPILAITPAGITQGLSVSLFANNFPLDFTEANGGVGSVGIAFPTTGGVLVTDAPGNIRLFPTDTDGQNASTVTPLQPSYNHNNAAGLAQVGSNIYMTQQFNGRVVQLNSNGSINQTIANIGNATGIVTDPVNGHLFVSTYGSGGIYDVDPIAKTATLFISADFDGLSTDGKTLYGADIANGHILGYDIATKQLVFDSGFIGSGGTASQGNDGLPDGTALGFGSLAGNIFANTNAGDVVEINLTTKVQTVIATGRARGDFVAVDPTNNSLLLTESGEIDRIIAANGGFGPPPSAAPEPSSWLLLSTGAFGLIGSYWRARRRNRPCAAWRSMRETPESAE